MNNIIVFVLILFFLLITSMPVHELSHYLMFKYYHPKAKIHFSICKTYTDNETYNKLSDQQIIIVLKAGLIGGCIWMVLIFIIFIQCFKEFLPGYIIGGLLALSINICFEVFTHNKTHDFYYISHLDEFKKSMDKTQKSNNVKLFIFIQFFIWTIFIVMIKYLPAYIQTIK